MVAGLRLKFTNIVITSKRLVRNGPNLAGIIYSAPSMEIYDQEILILKVKMAAGLRLKFTNIAKASKRLVRNGQNLAGIIYSAQAIRILLSKF